MLYSIDSGARSGLGARGQIANRCQRICPQLPIPGINDGQNRVEEVGLSNSKSDFLPSETFAEREGLAKYNPENGRVKRLPFRRATRPCPPEGLFFCDAKMPSLRMAFLQF